MDLPIITYTNPPGLCAGILCIDLFDMLMFFLMQTGIFNDGLFAIKVPGGQPRVIQVSEPGVHRVTAAC